MNYKRVKMGLCMALTAVSVCSVLPGCGKKSGDNVKIDTTQAAETVTQTAGETQAAMEAAVKTETGTNVDGDMVRVVSGIVMDPGSGSVTIKNDKYPEGITFATEGAAAGLTDGLLADMEITIFYRGEINDGDASGVKTELLRDKRSGDEEAQAAEVSGKIVSIGMSVVTIETADGRKLSFEQDPKPVNTTDGPDEGDRVTIVYSYQDEGQEGAVVPELIRAE